MIDFELHSLFPTKAKKLEDLPGFKKSYKEFREKYQNKTLQELKDDSEKWWKSGVDQSRRIYIPPNTRAFILYLDLHPEEGKVMLTEVYNSRG